MARVRSYDRCLTCRQPKPPSPSMFCSGACQLERLRQRRQHSGCPTCGETDPADGFAANGYCRRCDRVMRLRYRSAEGCRDARNVQSALRLHRLRETVLAAYGGRCECCGETRVEFLAIDHRNGGGGREREAGIRGESQYKHLRELGYPPDYRILCHNCNGAEGWRGGCPHHDNR